MKDKEIEKRIKEETDGIKMQSFSSRWSRIRGRLDIPRGQGEEVYSAVPAHVCVGRDGNRSSNGRLRAALIAVSAVAAVLLVAAAVLLWQLIESNRSRFGVRLSDVHQEVTTQREFYSQTRSAGLDLADFSAIDGYIESYALFFDTRGDVRGGRVSFLNDGMFIGDIEFYDMYVWDFNSVGEGYSMYSAGGTEVRYITEHYTDPVMPSYTTEASVLFGDTNYYIAYTSVADDAVSLFDGLFV